MLTYNHILAKFPISRSKVVLDNQHNKHSIRVSSHVAKPRESKNLTKLGNIWEKMWSGDRA